MMLAGKRGGVVHAAPHTKGGAVKEKPALDASINMHRSGILSYGGSTVLVRFVVAACGCVVSSLALTAGRR